MKKHRLNRPGFDDPVYVYIPNNLDIGNHIENYPPHEIRSFHRDKLLYIIGLISFIPFQNKKLISEDGYVPINADIVKSHIRDYKAYLEYLIRTGVFECNNHYTPSKKSKGYRFTLRYLETLIPVEITKYTIRKQLQCCDTNSLSKKEDASLHYLRQWWNPSLKIDYDGALTYLATEYDKNKEKVGSYKARQKYIIHKMTLDRFNRREFRFGVDTTAGRSHTNLTNMKSGLRNFITYNDIPLVSVDIKNSQPFLSSTLLNTSFYYTAKSAKIDLEDLEYWTDSLIIESKLTNSTLTLDNVGYKYYKYTNIDNNRLYNILNYLMAGKNEQSLAAVEIRLWCKLTSEGKLYKYIEDEVKARTGRVFPTSKQLKEVLFTALFTDNRFIGQKEAEAKRIFRDLFPFMYGLFALIKKGDATTLPRMLQAIEAKIILERICYRISKERPDLPIFTIHDSIICLIGCQNYIARVMKEEIGNAIGYIPTLRLEFWTTKEGEYWKPKEI